MTHTDIQLSLLWTMTYTETVLYQLVMADFRITQHIHKEACNKTYFTTLRTACYKAHTQKPVHGMLGHSLVHFRDQDMI